MRVYHWHKVSHTRSHSHTLIRLVRMKQYLGAGVIRPNSIGLWYFIIHLPTTPTIDSHIFLLHFVFSLINGAELMKMALSGLTHCWRTAFTLHELHVCMFDCVFVNFFTHGVLITLFLCITTWDVYTPTHTLIHTETHTHCKATLYIALGKYLSIWYGSMTACIFPCVNGFPALPHLTMG